jgi:hypothetical protein
MKRKLFLMLLITLCLSACGQEPLKSRNLIEADQYIRNNISGMKWKEFQGLLRTDSEVTEQDFKYLKDIVKKYEKTSHVTVNEKIYRFNHKLSLMYITVWKKDGNILYLQDINYTS